MNYSLGQYFTKDKKLQKVVYKFILNNPKTILEPSIGRGDLVKYILNKYKKKDIKIKFVMCEIDENIKLLDEINKEDVIYNNFLDYDINKKFKTIIGNPPYIRTKNGNLYIDFISKCYNLLKNKGELIFIIPSDFFKLTCSKDLLNEMLDNGTFTHIYHPHNENLFDNATVDIIIFRYCKDKKLNKKIIYNDEELYINNCDGLITFNKMKLDDKQIYFKDYFDIYVGMVTGKEEIYKNNDLGNIKLLNGENKLENYIYIDNYPSNNKKIDDYLLNNKEILINRKIRKFNDKNWFEWGAPRNKKNIEKNINKKCIYIYNLSRKTKIAFIDTVKYFGGNLIVLIPNKEINLENILNYLNSNEFKHNFMFSNRFKIGHRQLSNSIIPKNIL